MGRGVGRGEEEGEMAAGEKEEGGARFNTDKQALVRSTQVYGSMLLLRHYVFFLHCPADLLSLMLTLLPV